jgi:hypothetical protein
MRVDADKHTVVYALCEMHEITRKLWHIRELTRAAGNHDATIEINELVDIMQVMLPAPIKKAT